MSNEPLLSEILNLAKHEFDSAFGEVTQAMDEGEGTFYAYFSSEFLKGVTFGVENPDSTVEQLEIEAALRYLLAPQGDFGLLDSTSQEATGRGSGYVFLYGAHWAIAHGKHNN